MSIASKIVLIAAAPLLLLTEIALCLRLPQPLELTPQSAHVGGALLVLVFVGSMLRPASTCTSGFVIPDKVVEPYIVPP
jgi:hypothetical protein